MRWRVRGSAHLKCARAEVGGQQLKRVRSRCVKRLGEGVQIEESRLGRLLSVRPRVALPSPRQKEHGKAMGDVAVGVVDRVCLRL